MKDMRWPLLRKGMKVGQQPPRARRLLLKILGDQWCLRWCVDTKCSKVPYNFKLERTNYSDIQLFEIFVKFCVFSRFFARFSEKTTNFVRIMGLRRKEDWMIARLIHSNKPPNCFRARLFVILAFWPFFPLQNRSAPPRGNPTKSLFLSFESIFQSRLVYFSSLSSSRCDNQYVAFVARDLR